MCVVRALRGLSRFEGCGDGGRVMRWEEGGGCTRQGQSLQPLITHCSAVDIPSSAYTCLNLPQLTGFPFPHPFTHSCCARDRRGGAMDEQVPTTGPGETCLEREKVEKLHPCSVPEGQVVRGVPMVGGSGGSYSHLSRAHEQQH